MRSGRRTGLVPTVLGLCLVLVWAAAAHAGDEAGGARLWLATPGALQAFDTDGNRLARHRNLDGITALAPDVAGGRVWAYGHGRLTVLDTDGDPQEHASVPSRHGQSGPYRNLIPALNRYAGVIAPHPVADRAWLAVDDTLFLFSASGELLEELPWHASIRDLAIDVDNERLWIATAASLTARDARTGAEDDAIVGHGGLPSITRPLVFDVVEGVLWSAELHHLRAYDETGDGLDTFRIPGILHLAADSAGGVWAAGVTGLHRIHASGLVQARVQHALHPGRHGIIRGLAADEQGGVWVAGRDRAVYMTADGVQGAEAHVGGLPFAGIQAVALMEEALDLQWVAPGEGASVDTTRPTLRFTASRLDDGMVLSVRHEGEAVASDCLMERDEFACTLGEPLPEGELRLVARIETPRGERSPDVERSFTVDTTPPAITIDTPFDGLVTNEPTISVRGTVDEPATVSVNGEAGSGDDDTFAAQASLSEGDNTISVEAEDRAGNVATAHRTVELDTEPPEMVDMARVTVSGPDAQGLVTVESRAGSAEPGARVVVTNERTGETVAAAVDEDGGFTVRIEGEAQDTYTISLEDEAGNTTSPEELPDERLPADPARLAPELEAHTHTPFEEGVRFLYAGGNPVQRGVDPDTIDGDRAGVIRGRVRDRDGNALPGVRVRLLDRPEYGHTVTRADGRFDLAVNAGDSFIVVYEKDGYLPVQRKVRTRWRDYAWAGDVAMTEPDEQVTTVDLADDTQSFQVATGSLQSDVDGERRAVVLFPAGTTATMELPSGDQQALPTMDVRATEYTVGSDGPAAMPGELPATTAYTYAVELSADEAIEAGATRIQFNQSVPVYVDNFLDFPAGEAVPLGYYDREAGAWKGADDGQVIDILDVEAGRAVLDVTGEGEAATPSELAELGITEAEREQLAGLYEAGDSVWRVAVDHFTPWDCNWPWDLPEDASAPEVEIESDAEDDPPDEDECEAQGCIIDIQSQVLGEIIPLVGVPHELRYTSRRAQGRKSNEVRVPLARASDNLPGSLKRVEIEVTVAGRRLHRTVTSPEPGDVRAIAWDGKDAYGRTMYGAHEALVQLTYVYPCVYAGASGARGSAWARPGDGTAIGAIGNRQACDALTLSRSWSALVRSPATLHPADLGGWSLDAHHAYDPVARIVEKGDGERLDSAHQGNVLRSVTDGIRSPQGVAFLDGGDAVVTDSAEDTVHRVAQDGSVHPLVPAGLDLGSPAGITSDDAGGVYVADSLARRVIRVDEAGSVHRVVGTGEAGRPEDGEVAAEATLASPQDVAYVRGAGVYVADQGNNQVYRVAPDGTVAVVAGTGRAASGGDGGPAREASLNRPWSVAADDRGHLYVAERGGHSIRRILPNGTIETVAGTGESGSRGEDGAPAVETDIAFPISVAYDARTSSLYIGSRDGTVRRVGADGIVYTVAGGGDGRYVDGGSAAAGLRPDGLAIRPDGRVTIASTWGGEVVVVDTPYPDVGDDEYLVPSPDRSKLYRFDAAGRHVETRDPVTGATIHRFRYDGQGHLVAIADAHGNETTIERSGDGQVSAIVGPYGQRTTLSMNEEGMLSEVTDPLGLTHAMRYGAGGLLISFEDPDGHRDQFEYDDAGNLVRNTFPTGGGWTLERTRVGDNFILNLESAEGHESILRSPVGGRGAWRLDYENTGPSGATATRERYSSYTPRVETESTDGVREDVRFESDPQFGMATPVEQRRTSLPSGLRRRVAESREITWDESDGSLRKYVREHRINDSATVRQVYDSDQRLWQFTSPAGRSRSARLNETGQVLTQEQEGLAPVTYEYDARGRPITLTRGEGDQARSTELRYHEGGRQAGWLAAVERPLERETTFEYDSAGRVTTQTLPDGREVRFHWDGNGNLTGLIPPGRSAHVFEYDGVDQKTAYRPPELDGVDTVTRYRYNLDRQLRRVERPAGGVLRFDYDDAGRLRQRTGPEHVVTYGYAADSDQITSLRTADGVDLAREWDGFLPVAERWSGPFTGRVEREYDNRFQLSALGIAGRTLRFDRDADGLLIAAGDFAVEREASTGFVAATSLGSANGAFDYNAFGELIRKEHAVAGAGSLDIDLDESEVERTRLQVTGALAGRGEVHVNGESVSTEGTGVINGAVELSVGYNYLDVEVFDAAGELVEREATSVRVRPVGGETRSLRRVGGSLYFRADGAWRRIPVKGGADEHPGWLQGTYEFARDADGNIYFVDQAGAAVHLHDGGEVSELVSLDGYGFQNVRLARGPGGAVYLLGWPGGSEFELFLVAREGRLESVATVGDAPESYLPEFSGSDDSLLVGYGQEVVPTVAAEVQTGMQSDGNVPTILRITPEGVVETHHRPSSAFGRMAAAPDGRICYLWEFNEGGECRAPAGGVEALDLTSLEQPVRDIALGEGGAVYATSGNQVWDVRSGAATALRDLDEEGATEGTLTIEAQAVSGEPLVIDYRRDALGRVTQRSEVTYGETTEYAYSYDDSGRLTSVSVDGAKYASYTYDANGNRTAATIDGEAVTAEYDEQDRLLRYGDTTYDYTASGELRTRTDANGTTAYDYDLRGNLRSVDLADGPRIEYVIDGADRRVGKRVDGELVQGLLYKDALNPVAELDGESTVVSRFIYAEHPHVPSYMIRDGATYRIISDHLGSPRVVVDVATGEVAQELDYDAFGEIVRDTNPGFQPFGYAGGLYDPDTGLVRFGARDYDPETGRWTAKDPIRFRGGDTNLYGYVLNDPVNLFDPLGLQAFPGDPGPGANIPSPTAPNQPDPEINRYGSVEQEFDIARDVVTDRASDSTAICLVRCASTGTAQSMSLNRGERALIKRFGDGARVCMRYTMIRPVFLATDAYCVSQCLQ